MEVTPGLPVTNRQKLIREVQDYFSIGFGMVLYAVGWIVFLLPNDLPSGAVPGIASIVYWASGFPVQYTYLIINSILLFVALKVLGLKFCIKTIFAVTVLTVTTPLLQSLISRPLINNQPFMACVLGAFFCGGGIGIAFTGNGCTGGTDIIAAVVNKYRDISLGRVIMFCDLIIISSSYLVLHDWEKVVYGYVVLFISSFVLDRVVNSSRQSVQFFIISSRYEEIGKRINKDLHRGVTFIDGMGCYTHNQVKMMFVLAKRRESRTIFQLIQDIDPNAFVSQSAVIGVFGEGFDKIKAKKSHPQKTNKQIDGNSK